jgi:hypothetical protein
MEHPNLSQSNLVADKVNVDLNVLCAMMVDRISGHIDGANIVAVHVVVEAMGAWSSWRS